MKWLKAKFKAYHYSNSPIKEFQIGVGSGDRLIPNSVSFTNHHGWWSGKYKTSAYLNPKNAITVNLNDPLSGELDFFDFGKEEDTPVNRGKEIYEYAKENGVDLIRLKNVPTVGTEFAVLDPNIIEIIESGN